MLDGTFQLGAGLGPRREQLLWETGIASWKDFEEARTGKALPVPDRFAERLLRRIDHARAAFARDDVATVAAALPTREHWRLTPWLLDRAAFLDIETGWAGDVTAIGVWTPEGPRIFLPRGWSRDCPLEAFPDALAGIALLVTFNGASFDVPNLRKRFPSWEPPPVHVDLCHLWRRLGHRGGLKQLEAEQGIERPRAIRGLDGADAAELYAAGVRGHEEALQRFAAYNLADVAHLRPLLALGYNGLCAALDRSWASLPVPSRGEMLYDLSRVLLGVSLPSNARSPLPRGCERTFPVSTPTRLL